MIARTVKPIGPVKAPRTIPILGNTEANAVPKVAPVFITPATLPMFNSSPEIGPNILEIARPILPNIVNIGPNAISANPAHLMIPPNTFCVEPSKLFHQLITPLIPLAIALNALPN